MYGKKVKLRILFIAAFTAIIVLSIYLILKSLEENIVYFLSPSEIKDLSEINPKKIRVGGMVKKHSIQVNSNEINFIITDFKNQITVSYTGAVPNLFEEEKGVVAEGYLKDRSYLKATKILAKHDENYMPPEIKEIIENIPINSIVIYISDHGEVVGKGHGLARPSKDQFDVPFFIYDNSGMNEINAHHILSLSNGEAFNTQYIMDFITKLLGYDIGLNNREDPYQVYFSNGEKLDYKSLPDHYN